MDWSIKGHTRCRSKGEGRSVCLWHSREGVVCSDTESKAVLVRRIQLLFPRWKPSLSVESVAPSSVDWWSWGSTTTTTIASLSWAWWRFLITTVSETGWSHQEESSGNHQPSHHYHHHTHTTSIRGAVWTRRVLDTLIVSAVTLRIPQQVHESLHGILMVPYTLTGIKASICHLEWCLLDCWDDLSTNNFRHNWPKWLLRNCVGMGWQSRHIY